MASSPSAWLLRIFITGTFQIFLLFFEGGGEGGVDFLDIISKRDRIGSQKIKGFMKQGSIQVRFDPENSPGYSCFTNPLLKSPYPWFIFFTQHLLAI